jgi:hypothetical protein
MDSRFVDKVGNSLTKKGIRFWRDLHDGKAGRTEKQIDRVNCQNPKVLLVLSQDSLNSDWIEHEIHRARGLEKEMGHDILYSVTLDASWKDHRGSQRVTKSIMESSILDFSEWRNDSQLDRLLPRLIDELKLFHEG